MLCFGTIGCGTQDNIVQIMEYSNTVEGFYEELRFVLSLAALLLM